MQDKEEEMSDFVVLFHIDYARKKGFLERMDKLGMPYKLTSTHLLVPPEVERSWGVLGLPFREVLDHCEKLGDWKAALALMHLK